MKVMILVGLTDECPTEENIDAIPVDLPMRVTNRRDRHIHGTTSLIKDVYDLQVGPTTSTRSTPSRRSRSPSRREETHRRGL